MKKVFEDKIVNINNNNDNVFLFEYVNSWKKNDNIEVIYMSELLKKKKNNDMLLKSKEKPAIFSNVYSPKDELEIFNNLFLKARHENKKIHIIWITLKEELDILEEYYTQEWFKREDINCYEVDFKIPLITVSVKIENIMWKWSDYKRMKDKIFFNPPVRESGQVKSMIKWINKWIIANIYFEDLKPEYKEFLEKIINEEIILSITLAKLLKYNLERIWFEWQKETLEISYI